MSNSTVYIKAYDSTVFSNLGYSVCLGTVYNDAALVNYEMVSDSRGVSIVSSGSGYGSSSTFQNEAPVQEEIESLLLGGYDVVRTKLKQLNLMSQLIVDSSGVSSFGQNVYIEVNYGRDTETWISKILSMKVEVAEDAQRAEFGVQGQFLSSNSTTASDTYAKLPIKVTIIREPFWKSGIVYDMTLSATRSGTGATTSGFITYSVPTLGRYQHFVINSDTTVSDVEISPAIKINTQYTEVSASEGDFSGVDIFIGDVGNLDAYNGSYNSIDNFIDQYIVRFNEYYDPDNPELPLVPNVGDTVPEPPTTYSVPNFADGSVKILDKILTDTMFFGGRNYYLMIYLSSTPTGAEDAGYQYKITLRDAPGGSIGYTIVYAGNWESVEFVYSRKILVGPFKIPAYIQSTPTFQSTPLNLEVELRKSGTAQSITVQDAYLVPGDFRVHCDYEYFQYYNVSVFIPEDSNVPIYYTGTMPEPPTYNVTNTTGTVSMFYTYAAASNILEYSANKIILSPNKKYVAVLFPHYQDGDVFQDQALKTRVYYRKTRRSL